jgi:hypothetical protein
MGQSTVAEAMFVSMVIREKRQESYLAIPFVCVFIAKLKRENISTCRRSKRSIAVRHS